MNAPPPHTEFESPPTPAWTAVHLQLVPEPTLSPPSAPRPRPPPFCSGGPPPQAPWDGQCAGTRQHRVGAERGRRRCPSEDHRRTAVTTEGRTGGRRRRWTDGPLAGTRRHPASHRWRWAYSGTAVWPHTDSGRRVPRWRTGTGLAQGPQGDEARKRAPDGPPRSTERMARGANGGWRVTTAVGYPPTAVVTLQPPSSRV